MTESSPPTTTTEIDIGGANCPWCLNETVDVLRARPGVVGVDASITGQCVRVEHRGVDIDQLLDTIRTHLHADAVASAEHVMAPVEPHVREHVCQRHAGHAPA